MIGSLFWKEWREHLWKMGACFTVLCVPVLYAQVWQFRHNRAAGWELSFSLILLISWVMAIWISAWTLTGERTTQRVLEALPVQWWKIFGMKILLGLATLLVPMVGVLALVGTEGPGWPVSETFPRIPACIAVIHLYLMILAVGMGVSREGMAALLGVVVFLSNMMGGALLSDMDPNNGPLVRFFFPLIALLNRPFFAGPTDPVWGHLAECAFLCAIAAFRFRNQWGRGPVVRGTSLNPRPTTTRLRTRPFPLGPLLWKEWREQRDLLIASTIAGFGIAALIGFTEARSEPMHPGFGTLAAANALAVMGLTVPLIIAIILGISSWTSDLDTGIETFWRSRPLSSARLFWIKYATGIAGTLLLAALFSVGAEIALAELLHQTSTYIRHDFLYSPTSFLKQSAIWCPLAFTATALLKLLIRHPIYAGILAVGAAVGVAAMVLSSPRNVNWTSANIAVTIYGITLVLAVLGSKSLQKNWRLG